MSAGKLTEAKAAPAAPAAPTIEAKILITRSSDPREKFKVTFEGDWSVVQLNAIQPLLRTARRQYINSQKENVND